MINKLIILVLAGYLLAFSLNLPWLISSAKQITRGVQTFFIAWILLFMGVAVYFYREDHVTGLGSMDASAWYQVTSISLGGIIVLGIVVTNNAFINIIRGPVLLLLLYGIFAVLSTIYSPAPRVSFYKGSLILLDVLAVCAALAVLKTHDDIKRLFDVTYFMISLFAVGALVGGIINPEGAFREINGGAFGFVFEGTLPYMNANELGFLAAVTAIVAFRRLFEPISNKRKLFWLTQLAVGVLVLFLAQARTSLITFIFSSALLCYVIPRLRIISFLLAGLLVLSIGYLVVSGELENSADLAATTTQEYFSRGQDDAGLKSLEGRVRMWMSLGMRMFSDSPILGHGYDVGTRYGAEKYGMQGHMHNSHVQILVNSGLLGYLVWLPMILIVFAKLIIIQLKQFLPASNFVGRFHSEVLIIILMIVLRTATGSVAVNHSWSLMLILAAMIYVSGKFNTDKVCNIDLRNQLNKVPILKPRQNTRLLAPRQQFIHLNNDT